MYYKIIYKLQQIIKKFFSDSSGGYFYMKDKKNIGDSMVPWLLVKITGQEFIKYSNPLESKGIHILTVGSIMEVATKECIVWGSGFIKDKSRYKSPPFQIHAVRGLNTIETLNSLEYNTENVVTGDPGLLVSNFYPVNKKIKSEKIAIIPHYIDAESINVKNFSKKIDADILSVETENVEAFCKVINTYDLIISSSLHGLILADAYCIPNIWVEFSNKVVGDGFKFRDYFSNFTDKYKSISPTTLDFIEKCNSFEKLILISNRRDKNDIINIQKRLIECFPDVIK